MVRLVSTPSNEVEQHSCLCWSVAFHLSCEDSRRCTYHRPLGPFRGAAPYVRIHTDTSGLAALGCLHCQPGWRIELFGSSHRTPLCVWNLIKSQMLFRGAANLRRCVCPVVVAAFWAAKCHTPSAFHLPVTRRNLKTASASLRPEPLALRRHPCRQGSNGWHYPLAMLVRRLVHREVGTTRYSPAADVPRFRASEPPFFPRYLHRHDDHGLGAMIARFRGRPGLAWAVRDDSRREGFQAPSPLTGSHRLSGPCPHRFFEFPRGTDGPLIEKVGLKW